MPIIPQFVLDQQRMQQVPPQMIAPRLTPPPNQLLQSQPQPSPPPSIILPVGNPWANLNTWAYSNMDSLNPWVRGAASVFGLVTDPVRWYGTPKASLSSILVGWGEQQSASILTSFGTSNPWARGSASAVSALTQYAGGLAGSAESMVNPFTPNLIGSLSSPDQKTYIQQHPYYNIGSYVGEMAMILPGGESLASEAFKTLPRTTADIIPWLKGGFTVGGEKAALVTKWAEYPLKSTFTYAEELGPKGFLTIDKTEVAGKIFKVGSERLPASELYDVGAEFSLTEKTAVKGSAEFGGYRMTATTIQPGSLLETTITKSQKGNVQAFRSVTDTLFPKTKTFKYAEETMSMDRLVTMPETTSMMETETLTQKDLKLGSGFRLGGPWEFPSKTSKITKVQPDWTGMQAGYLNENLASSLDKFDSGLNKSISSFSGKEAPTDAKAFTAAGRSGGGSTSALWTKSTLSEDLGTDYLYTVDFGSKLGLDAGLSLSPLFKTGMALGLGVKTGISTSTSLFSGSFLGQRQFQGMGSALALDVGLATKTITERTPVSIVTPSLTFGQITITEPPTIPPVNPPPPPPFKPLKTSLPSRNEDLFSFGRGARGLRYSEKTNPFNENFLSLGKKKKGSIWS